MLSASMVWPSCVNCRFAHHGAGAVRRTKGLCFFVLEAEDDPVRGELHIPVFHRGGTKEVHGLLGQIVPHAVPGPVVHFTLQGLRRAPRPWRTSTRT